jgi:hypothetical protein
MGGIDQHLQPTTAYKTCLRPLVWHTGETDKGEAPTNLKNEEMVKEA